MIRAILLAIVGLAWAATALFTVDQSEYVYLTQFGRPVVTYDGSTEAGLHVKWPWPVQTAQKLERRTQQFDLPPAELLTHDPRGRTIDRTLTVEAFVRWRIAGRDGVDKFVRTVGSPEQARVIVGQRVGGRLGAVVGTLPLDELIGVAEPDAVAERAERLRRLLLGDGEAEAYGIEVLDVRLRRFNYPASVRPSIHDRIVSERNRKAAEYQAEGLRRAEEIRSAAERDARTLLAEAKAEEQRLRQSAEAEADAVRSQAHARDPAFFAFLQKLSAYQRMLAESRDVLLLSSRHELFDLLLKPPAADVQKKPAR